MKKIFLTLSVFLLAVFPVFRALAISLSQVSGRIVLQVEKNGEAWYVSPLKFERSYLGRPSDAFALMRETGTGIRNVDLEKIPLGLDNMTGADSDRDGLPDELEKAIKTNYLLADTDGDSYNDLGELASGNNPRGVGKLSYDSKFVNKNLGKIFLQLESRGEAWYVFPPNGKRYFLGKPSDAFNLMRKTGLGISNKDLEKLTALTPSFDIVSFEKRIHDFINIERVKNGLSPLKLNTDLSAVARRHSQSLTNENKNFSGIDAVCSYPLIHHEGLDFGIYHGERLENSGIRYFKMSGENIALLTAALVSLTYEEGSLDPKIFDECSVEQTLWDKEFKERIEKETNVDTKITMLKSEIAKRKTAYSKSPHLEIGSAEWQDVDELAKRAVEGWMNSPGHRKNILTTDYDEAGMGVAYVNSYVIITQVFIARTDCGYKGAACCDRGDYETCYLPNTCEMGVCK